ncbi:MAG TPA: DUF5925 domain-containing protein [Solirubrobacteraceae bacterium]
MPLRTDNVQLTLPPHAASERCANAACATYFLDAMRREDLRCVRSIEVERRSRLLGDVEQFGEVELRWRVEDGEDAVLRADHEGETVVVLLVGEDGMCEVVAAAEEYEAANAVATRLAEALRDPPPPEARLTVRFWSMAGHGPSWRRRHVEAEPWDAIDRNYPAQVRARIDELVALREPRGGSLVLWHGPPGTGKTHALRALARAWEPWATTHYVTDPEQLLRGTGYLMEVATDGDDERWRLVVLEDAGELMAADARSEIGQGLSRVLNLSDGLLGQGVRCLLLVTTNEPIGRLHPAVRRPGRCLAAVDFPAFSAVEASAWLALRGIDRELRAPATLAELFAVADGREAERGVGPGEAFGFARALRR